MSKLLTVRQAAVHIGFHEKTVYKLIREGVIPAVRLGYGPKARLRVAEDELERFLFDGDAA